MRTEPSAGGPRRCSSSRSRPTGSTAGSPADTTSSPTSGKLLDPIADKVLTGFAFIGLSILGELPWWVTVLVLVREVGHHGAPSRRRERPRRRGRVDGQAEDAGPGGRALPRPPAALDARGGLDPLGQHRHACGSPCCSPSRAASTTSSRRCAALVGSGIARERPRRRCGRGLRRPTRCSMPSRRAAGRSASRSRSPEAWWCESLISVPGASASVRGRDRGVRHSRQGLAAAASIESLLDAHGAVHPEVARQMADGVRDALAIGGEAADVGLSTTGIAGPDSPDGQPVGTVFIGVATPYGSRVDVAAPARGPREDPARDRAPGDPARARGLGRRSITGGIRSVSPRLHSVIRIPSSAEGIRLESAGVVLLSTRQADPVVKEGAHHDSGTSRNRRRPAGLPPSERPDAPAGCEPRQRRARVPQRGRAGPEGSIERDSRLGGGCARCPDLDHHARGRRPHLGARGNPLVPGCRARRSGRVGRRRTLASTENGGEAYMRRSEFLRAVDDEFGARGPL